MTAAALTSTAHFATELLRLADCAHEQCERAASVGEEGQADGWAETRLALRRLADDATESLEFFDADGVSR